MKVTIYKSDSSVLKEVHISQDSVMSNEIRGEHSLTLAFELSEFIEIPEGSYVSFENETFTLLSAQKVGMKHTRNYEYTVVFQSSSALLSDSILKNPEDGRLTFPYTAKAEEHLSLIVSNLNRDGNGGWSIGECITDGSTKYLQYNYVNCRDALDSIADLYGTEWEIVDKEISLHKVEHNKNAPLEIQYGEGNGLRSGIIRETVQRPLTRLYTQGGSTNIDPSDYGSSILLLPKSASLKYDGNKFEDEEGFNNTDARTYTTDSGGTYISSTRNANIRMREGVIDCSDIYPNAEHEVISYDADEISVLLDISEDLNYSQYQILGKLPTITFQSGELTGRTFEISRDDNGTLVSEKVYSENDEFVGWRFTLKKIYSDGRAVPDTEAGLVPQEGDKCRFFGVKMPSQYIANNADKSGASWDMLRRGIEYLYENEQYIYSLRVEVDPIWAKKNWADVSSKFILGGYVKYSNAEWAKDGIVMRIQSIRQSASNPCLMEIELGNGIVGGDILKGLRDSISMQKGSISDQSSGLSSLEYDVSSQNTRYVTISTFQKITGEKHFYGDVVFGGDGAKLFLPSTEGPGKYYMYFDSVSAVDGEVPTASGGGLDVDAMWEALAGEGTKQIHPSHLSDALSGYLTEVKIDTIGDLNAGWDSLLKAAPDFYSKSDSDARYVTLATEQVITGKKTFNNDVVFGGGGSKMFVPSTAGAGLYYMYFDVASAVNGETPTASGGLDVDELWAELGGSSSNKVIAQSHIPDIYVKKAGDTMTGQLAISTPSGHNVRLSTTNNEGYMSVYVNSSYEGAVGYNTSYGTFLYNRRAGKYIGLRSDGELYNSYDSKYWHSGNDGSGSGLDADLLDGYHAANFIAFTVQPNYVAARFISSEVAAKAASTYIEFWNSNGGWYNSAWGYIRANSYITTNKLYVPSSQGNQVFDIYIQ